MDDRAVACPAFDLSFLNDSPKRTLLIVGDRDSYCPLDLLSRMLERISPPIERVRLEGADHFLGGREERIASEVVRFVTDRRSSEEPP